MTAWIDPIPALGSAAWFARDAERNERARVERLRADARKGPGRNLEEGAAFVEFALEFAEAFKRARA
jgi:hypothetical protein